jgi:hypothetical protein
MLLLEKCIYVVLAQSGYWRQQAKAVELCDHGDVMYPPVVKAAFSGFAAWHLKGQTIHHCLNLSISNAAEKTAPDPGKPTLPRSRTSCNT